MWHGQPLPPCRQWLASPRLPGSAAGCRCGARASVHASVRGCVQGSLMYRRCLGNESLGWVPGPIDLPAVYAS